MTSILMNAFKRRLWAAAMATALCAMSSVGWTEDVDAASVIEGRQYNLRDLGAAFKGINDELRKSTPQLGLVRQYAEQIDDLAKQQKFWFPQGTGPQSGVETEARAIIWAEPEKFAAAQQAMSTEAAKFMQVAKASDVAAVKEQHRALGKTCKGCHDTFREEKE